MKFAILLLVAVCAIATATAENRIICYYTNWSAYRTGNSQYLPSDLDASLCTNILYSFATLNPDTLTIEVYDREMDITNKFYEQVTALKSQGVKVSIAIGGWSDSASNKYSRMVSTPQSRAIFITSVLSFIKRYNFDGLDLDWEYPSCWVGDCDGGPAIDKENFAHLLREMRARFDADGNGYLLSSAVAASRWTGDHAYDVPALAENLDWIGLMTYDYHGGWDGVTGHNSPLKGSAPNSEDTVNYWVSKGAPAEKLILGVALYGRSFTLANPGDNWVGAPATTGEPGEYTNEGGFLAYFEMCTGWTYRNVENVGPYAFKGDQWVSFDDTAIITKKAEYIKERGMQGAMVWAIDLDDFNGTFCGQGTYPLMRALRAAL